MKSIGLVGCGAIARFVLRAVDEGRLNVPVCGVTSRTESTARVFLATLKQPVPWLSLDDLIEGSDIVVEAAGSHVVPDLARRTFDRGKALIVISIGALLDHPEVMTLAREKGCGLILPSGAIAGLDAVKAACAGRVDYVRLTSRKPPRALEGAPFLIQNGISLDGLTNERQLFTGPA